MSKILVMHGPNLNILGQREPERYGTTALHTIDQQLVQSAHQFEHELVTFQSNAEYELVDRIQETLKNPVDYIIINPAAFTHTSVALRDALLAVNIPFIEIHISNIYARDEFRHKSFFSDIANGVISGFGVYGYQLALHAAHEFLTQKLKHRGNE